MAGLDKGCSSTPHLRPQAIRATGQGVPQSHMGPTKRFMAAGGS